MDRSRDQDEFDFSQASDLVKQRQRFPRSARHSATIVNQLLASRGYGQLESNNDLEAGWKEAVGTKWAGSTKVGNVRRGILDVLVSNSATLQHLTFQKKKFLAKIQNQMPQNKIKDIKFRVGKID